MMSPISLRSQMRRTKRRIALIAALLVVSSAIAAHHAMPDGVHVGMETAAVCLAVIGIAAVAVSAAIDLLAQPRPSWLIRLAVGESRLEQPVRGVPARAGPRGLQVLRL